MKRDQVDAAAAQFSMLNIASVGRKAMDQLEWSGGHNPNQFANDAVDSDDDVADDEVDPLKIIAGSNVNNRIVKIEKKETLITEGDLKDIEEIKAADRNTVEADPQNPEAGAVNIKVETERMDDKATKAVVMDVGINNKSRVLKLVDKIVVKSTLNENMINKVAELLEPHALYLCEKALSSNDNPRLKFLPSRTTLTDVHNPKREMQRRTHKNWEATAATPPLLRHDGVKALTLEDSIEIQRHSFEAIKKMREEQAHERLVQREIRMRDRSLVESMANDAVFFSDYRDPAAADDVDEDDSDQASEDSDEEVLDEEDEKGGVIYNIEG